MAQALWLVDKTADRRFPFRVAIEQDGRTVLAVRSQSPWPGPGQQVFCLRERGDVAGESLDPLERVPVVHLGRVGRKLTVVLDRPTRKRCEFLAIQRTTKDGRAVEQLFFRTESGIRAHRSRTRMELLPGAAPAGPLTIAVDTAERYPWRFPGATLVRRRLASGDYALIEAGRSVAVVERKTFDGFLGDIGAIQALHHQLEDLGSLPTAALVIEAQYADFLDGKRLAGRWPATHLARVLAEVAALHPHLPVVFAGNRPLANAWCARFFAACAQREASPQLDLVSETLARYRAGPREAGVEERIRVSALESADGSFTFAELAGRFGDVPAGRVRRVLGQLRDEGLLECTGRGRGTRWLVRAR
jgi:hypothetical protein